MTSECAQPDFEFFSMFESFDIPVFAIEPNGKIVYANNGFASRLSMQPDECLGTNLYEQMSSVLHIPEIAAERKKRFDEALRTKKHLAFEDERDGITLKHSLYPVRLVDGAETRLLVIIQDISDQKRRESDAHKGLAILNAIVDTIPASVIVVDARMRLVGWNRFSRDIINAKPDNEMLGVIPFERVHPEDRVSIINKAFFNVLNFGIEETAEFRMRHRNEEEYKWATLRARRIIVEEQPFVVAVVTETTELKKAEDERKKLQAQLQQSQKMEMLGQLAGGIAHDFNNALTAILGNAELILQRLNSSDRLAENIQDIHLAATHSAELVRKLLAFARKQVTQPEIVILDDEIEALLPMLGRLIGENIRVRWHPDSAGARVCVDPSQIAQIVSNLCINSRDAIAGSGSIDVSTDTIHVSREQSRSGHPCTTPGDYVRLAVADNGSGIDKQTLPHIFEPFFTTKEVGKGTGLGLSMIYGILQQNHGFIECSTEMGKGTAFTLYIPQYQGILCNEDNQLPEPSRKDRNETVLLVEDEPFIIKIITELLENNGFSVLSATDAETAVELDGEHQGRIDLLISDVMLPGMNGVQLAKKLQERHTGLKVLFMSGYAFETIGHHGTFEEGVDFIQKPFGIDEFMNIVQKAIPIA
ncbi:MAG: response regulator [Chlorobiaceae bacterium]|nr:response regulator [Chlorobiaceae bacterium]